MKHSIAGRRLTSVLVASSAAVMLQGCVAALVPLAAGGLMGTAADTIPDDEPAENVAQTLEDASDSAPESAPPPQPQSEPEPVISAETVEPETDPVRLASVPEPASEPVPASPPATVAAREESPAPPETPTASQSASTTSLNAITSLISYANQQQFASMETRRSAMLNDQVILEPVRAPCVGIRPTVLIDLDPEGESFSPTDAGRPPSGLAGGLEQLRQTGLEIAWIASRPASDANAIREALRSSGLDPVGRDQLLLIRKADDRKQTLRKGLAETACIIAIAGDTRSDFDELYDYLLNPDDAIALEPMIGNGWFLIPQPLLSEGSN